MPVTEITTELQFNNYLNDTTGNRYLFVDFYTQWCGPCKKVAPHIDKLSEMYTTVTFLKVDIDKCRSLADTYNIKSIPTFLIFKVGRPTPAEPIIGADIKKIENALKVLTTNMTLSVDF